MLVGKYCEEIRKEVGSMRALYHEIKNDYFGEVAFEQRLKEKMNEPLEHLREDSR